MKRVLIVSPRFAPSSGADTHRVRMSLPWFRRFGWEPVVLRVAADADPGVKDDLLRRTLPDDIAVLESGALPLRLCAPLGLSDVAIRAWRAMYRLGAREIQARRPHVAFFSTTSFLSMTLGPAWRRDFGLPFVLDIQDMWANEAPALRHGLKHSLMRWVHARAEARTLPLASGIVSVSPGYLSTLARRYPMLTKTVDAIPFGASEADFAVLGQEGLPSRFLKREGNRINVVYAGAAGNNMHRALRVLFRALRLGLAETPALFSRMHLFFVGTIYSDPSHAQAIERLAREEGVQQHVEELAGRIPYLETLRLLVGADLLIVPGVDEGEYVASKILPYLMSGTPVLSVMHERSAARDVLAQIPVGVGSVWFGPARPIDAYVPECRAHWERLATEKARRPSGLLDPALQAWSVEALTGRLCALFDQAAGHA